ncbi:hypothetical protein C3K47_11590 [Solitalea longa]|uniref:Uncharacterized protein n=1 Tax=Solitalea longa TaxID=2079460 RepID=A0A2S5A2P7_9SPHI|nr:hypothetical protein C3K47_11590 [Solitalea longa]
MHTSTIDEIIAELESVNQIVIGWLKSKAGLIKITLWVMFDWKKACRIMHVLSSYQKKRFSLRA